MFSAQLFWPTWSLSCVPFAKIPLVWWSDHFYGIWSSFGEDSQNGSHITHQNHPPPTFLFSAIITLANNQTLTMVGHPDDATTMPSMWLISQHGMVARVSVRKLAIFTCISFFEKMFSVRLFGLNEVSQVCDLQKYQKHQNRTTLRGARAVLMTVVAVGMGKKSSKSQKFQSDLTSFKMYS